ncbi:MAG: FtsX-like permease family protein [Hyphomonadaceae bacterium]
MRINAIAIAMVLGCGLSIFVMAVGMRESLEHTRHEYYANQQMADLAVSLVRAPERVEFDLAAAPGVAVVEARVAGLALLDLPGVVEPASARLVSLPSNGKPLVNNLVLARGRWPDPTVAEEVLVNEAFAKALDLETGATLEATLRGRRQTLRIVGIANSPEFVFVSAPGELFPQPDRFAVIWMGHEALARAYDFEGAFNEAVFRLAPDADQKLAKRSIDAIVERYGSTGVYGRDRMPSDRFLTEELRQLATMATFLPAIFLVIAAFLVNVSLARIVATERSNIGLLKAFGYSDAAVGWHYAKSALMLGAVGALIGSGAGVWLGRLIAAVYRDYYHFPRLDFAAPLWIFVAAFAAALASASAGALFAVMNAARIAPAAALAPPRPVAFSQSNGLTGALSRHLDAKSRVIVRRIVRFPRRSATTVIGIALAIGLLVVARTFPAVMDRLLDVHFSQANRQDVTLSFIDAREEGVLHAVRQLPGVIYAEPTRVDSVILHNGVRSVEEVLIGSKPDTRLGRLIGAGGKLLPPPAAGVALARALAAKLGVKTGDWIDVEQTRGARVRASVRVAAIVDPMVGSSAYMDLDAQARLMREPRQITGANVRLDPASYDAFNSALKRTPTLAGASFLTLAEQSMRRSFQEGVGYMNLVYLSFAAVMAGGVAFSAARVTLAEQERDLATLRVLGFTRFEVSYVLIGELAALAFLAIPAGCVAGTLMANWLMQLFQTDMYSFPYVFNPEGYGLAISFTLACVAVAAFVVRGGIDRLDMVAVLKGRD